MKKRYKKTLIVTASIIATIALLLGVGTLLLNTSHVQQWLLQRATAMLAEKLNTRVEVQSVSINLYVPSMALNGLCIDDQQGEPLLRMQQANVKVGIINLWEREFVIKQVKAEGVEARLVKADPDSVPNYQFLIDAFSKKKEQQEDQPNGSDTEKSKWKLTLQPLKHLQLKDTHITYQVAEKKTTAELQRLDAKWRDEGYRFSLDNMHLATDNGKPQPSTHASLAQKFDFNHLNLTVNAQGSFQPIEKDSLHLTLTETTIQDPTTGIDISDLTLHVAASRAKLILTDLNLKQGSTTLQIGKAHITLPHPKKGQQLAYDVENISGNVVLHDIAQPFAPVLKGFHLPLQLTANVSGTDDRITFKKVQAATADKRLSLTTHGHIRNLSGKQSTIISIDVDRLLSKRGMAEKVINQFVVKKLMMNQLHQLGDISYRGHFDVQNGCEAFSGRLTTQAGDLDFRFTINDHTQRLNGSFSSGAIKVGEVMDMPNIGNVDCRAAFDIDISKHRTAQMRRQKGGKLPIGTVTATVNDCSYKRMHMRNIDIDIQSDGADATGNIVQQGNRRQIHCAFVYNENDPKRKLRIMDAGISFHKKKQDAAEPQDSIPAKKKKEKKRRKSSNS